MTNEARTAGTTPERLRQVRGLFERLLELPSAERPAALERARAEDPALAAEAETLLAAHERDDSLFEKPILERLSPEACETPRVSCPSCGATNDEPADVCFRCGRSFQVLTQGTVLASRYDILSPLGRGGMGMVYKAYDRILDENVAIKIVRSEVAQSAQMRRRFLSEIKLARKVSHRNVCRIHEYGEDAGLRFISMELIEGVELRQLIRQRGALPAAEAFDIAIQAARGLEAVHEVGIVHRDLKTSNIMRDTRGIVRLMDFGIARLAEAGPTAGGTATGQVIGTPEYMSPEQGRGEKVDLRSDLYALGIVVFEVFTGRVPFRGETPLATILMHLHDPLPLQGELADRIPRALVPVLARALEKDPDRRFATASGLVEALSRARAETFGEPYLTPITLARASGEPFATPAPASGASPLQITSQGATAVSDTSVRQAPSGDARLQKPAQSPWSGARPLLLLAGAALAIGLALWLRDRLQRSSDAPVSVAQLPAPTVASSSPASSGLAPAPTPALSPLPSSRPAGPPAAASERPDASEAAQAPGARLRGSRSVSPAPRPSASALPSTPTATPQPTSQPPATLAAAGETTPAASPTPAAAVAAPSPTPAPAVAPEPRGILQLVVVPFAEATIDGAAFGRVSSNRIPLEPGSHTIRLSHPEYQPLQRKVTIAAGDTLRIVIDLAEEAVPKR